MTLEEKIKTLPDDPGIYLMKNKDGKIIYVGKAKVLKNRVRQYFQPSKNHPPKVAAMVSNIADFEYIVTRTELEAFALEFNYIKKYKPYYNILLKDDKAYPYIKVTLQNDYPQNIFVPPGGKGRREIFRPLHRRLSGSGNHFHDEKNF